MRTYKINTKTKIDCNNGYIAKTIEEQIELITSNKEPIDKTAPIIYTERKDGIMPEYDIRTDRFEIAMKAADKASAADIAKRKANNKKDDEIDKQTEEKTEIKQE